MNYKAKRLRTGLSPYTVAKELGIDYEKYLLVEKGKIRLENGYIDKFLDIIKDAKTIKFNRMQRMNDIKKYCKDGQLKVLMINRGYNGTKLMQATGISNSEISRCMNYNENSKRPNDDTLERLYDFLNDPINKYIEPNTTKKEQKTASEVFSDEEIEKYDELMKTNKIARKDVAEALGYTVSTINNLFSRTSYVSQKAAKKFIEYMKQYENPIEEEIPIEEPTKELPQDPTPIEEPQVEIQIEEPQIEETPIEETPIEENQMKETIIDNITYRDYIDLLVENQKLQDKLNQAERQIRLYEKLIDRL